MILNCRFSVLGFCFLVSQIFISCGGSKSSSVDTPQVSSTASTSTEDSDYNSPERVRCRNRARLGILHIGLPADDRECSNIVEDHFQCIAHVTNENPEIPTIPLETLSSSSSSEQGPKVLSLGEGFTGLVAYIRTFGVRAFGLDIAPEYQTLSDPLLSQNPEFYRYGDATRLSQHELVTSSSEDVPRLILSFCMICSMPGTQSIEDALVESVKSVSLLGEVRYSSAIHDLITHDVDFMPFLLERVLHRLHEENIDAEISVSTVHHYPVYPGESPPELPLARYIKFRVIRLKKIPYLQEVPELQPVRARSCPETGWA